MSKVTIVNYGDDSRKKLINGVNQLADAVCNYFRTKWEECCNPK
jgi:hypothetical protein